MCNINSVPFSSSLNDNCRSDVRVSGTSDNQSSLFSCLEIGSSLGTSGNSADSCDLLVTSCLSCFFIRSKKKEIVIFYQSFLSNDKMKDKKYHTIGTVLKSRKTIKYHTIGTVQKSRKTKNTQHTCLAFFRPVCLTMVHVTVTSAHIVYELL